MSLRAILSSLQTVEANKTNKKYIEIKAIKKIGFLTEIAKHLTNHETGILVLLTSAYLLSSEAEKFFFLQYKDPKSGLYKKGKDDMYFVFTWVVLFTFLRAALTKYVWIPLAKLGGVKKSHRLRFAEQGSAFLYYLVFCTIGMYLIFKSPYWFDTTHFWKGYPHIEMSGLFKWYYLVQLAFFIQQVIAINFEKNPRDYLEMLIHHIVAALLMGCSYSMNLTRIGNAVLCLMDSSDLTLPIAKMLKYCGFKVACNIVFGLSIISWIVTRHYLNLYIVYSSWFESSQFMELKWAPEEEHYYSETTRVFFLILFIILQGLILYWFYYICRVAYRIIKGDDNIKSDSNNNDSEYSEWEDA